MGNRVGECTIRLTALSEEVEDVLSGQRRVVSMGFDVTFLDLSSPVPGPTMFAVAEHFIPRAADRFNCTARAWRRNAGELEMPGMHVTAATAGRGVLLDACC